MKRTPGRGCESKALCDAAARSVMPRLCSACVRCHRPNGADCTALEECTEPPHCTVAYRFRQRLVRLEVLG